MKLRSSGMLVPLLLLFSFAGCAVTLIAPYDETTDRLLTDLTVRTETAVAKADAGQLPPADRDAFYAEAEGAVQTMKMRASLYDKNEKETAALTALGQRYRDLRDHHVAPRTSFSTGLRDTLLTVAQIEVAKKRSTSFNSGLKRSTAAP